MCDIGHEPTHRKPNNFVPVDTEDYVIMSQSFIIYDSPRFLCFLCLIAL